MLKNRKERINNNKEIQERFKSLFKIYVEKKYSYCGGNCGHHLVYYRILFPNIKNIIYEYCYICGRDLIHLNKFSEVFYIYEPFKYNNHI
jgi:hypothetical protein